MLLSLLVGCLEYQVVEPPKVPPAEPPGLPDQGYGGPPNWADCSGGWLGRYSNLAATHPDMEPGPESPLPTDPSELDWWDDVAFTEFEAGLDFGTNWWPVDDGLASDPDYFAVSWVAWLRATDDTNLEFLFGANTDAWILLDDTPIAEIVGAQVFEQSVRNVSIDSGQYPIVIRYAHRGGNSGFRFRVLGGDVQICYPDFEDE